MNTNWFEVDKEGLSAQLERRGKAFAIFELIQNAWDSGTSCCNVVMREIPGVPYVYISVEDFSDTGFENLDHAHTLFAPSSRASDPLKRGRFNLGEKLVLALCRQAKITTKNGSVIFDSNGRRRSDYSRYVGTMFECEMRMTREEMKIVGYDICRLIPPVHTTLNFTDIVPPTLLKKVENVRLQTECAAPDHVIRRLTRPTTIEIYPADDGLPGEILELGIPVVEAPLGFRVNILQKVPLNMDRDNVQPSFVQSVRVAVVNAMYAQLTEEQAAASWVQDACEDSRITAEAFNAIQGKRFGELAVVAVPGDPTANATAEARGFQVVHGGSLGAGAWANARKFNTFQTSSAVFPTPKPEVIAAAESQVCPLCGK